jgi:hypothetical protein
MLDPGMGAVAAGDGAMSEPHPGSGMGQSGVRTPVPPEERGSLYDTVLARNSKTRNLETRMRDLSGDP